MTIKVDLENLAKEVQTRGPGFLVSTGPDGRPHIVQVMFDISEVTLSAPAGRKTSRNITERKLVALVWPPQEAGGYNLIIDGEATIKDLDSEGKGTAVITATHAILHRNAQDGSHDCVDLP